MVSSKLSLSLSLSLSLCPYKYKTVTVHIYIYAHNVYMIYVSLSSDLFTPNINYCTHTTFLLRLLVLANLDPKAFEFVGLGQKLLVLICCQNNVKQHCLLVLIWSWLLLERVEEYTIHDSSSSTHSSTN